jgi:hypothetical protein
MKSLHEWLLERDERVPDPSVRNGPGVPGASTRTWLLSALAVFVISLFFAMYMLDARAVEDGSVLDARALRAIQLTPQVSQVKLPVKPAEPTESMRRAVDISATLMVIAERAGTVTAAVGLANNRINRMIASGNAASNVLQFAQASEELAPGSNVAETLQELAVALSAYDIDRVRSTSLRLAELRQQLSISISVSQQTNNAPANLKLE